MDGGLRQLQADTGEAALSPDGSRIVFEKDQELYPDTAPVRNRIETLWNWGWSALTHERAARIIIEGDEGTRKTS
jgi:hypothetical protein